MERGGTLVSRFARCDLWDGVGGALASRMAMQKGGNEVHEACYLVKSGIGTVFKKQTAEGLRDHDGDPCTGI